MRKLKETPVIDEDFLRLPDDNKVYSFLKNGIMLMFKKISSVLISINFYFVPAEGCQKFTGFFSLIISDSSTKKIYHKGIGDSNL